MSISISCKELRIDCDFVTQGETETAAIDSLMHHVHTGHKEEWEDWFEIEEIYHAACKAIREKAA